MASNDESFISVRNYRTWGWMWWCRCGKQDTGFGSKEMALADGDRHFNVARFKEEELEKASSAKDTHQLDVKAVRAALSFGCPDQSADEAFDRILSQLAAVKHELRVVRLFQGV